MGDYQKISDPLPRGADNWAISVTGLPDGKFFYREFVTRKDAIDFAKERWPDAEIDVSTGRFPKWVKVSSVVEARTGRVRLILGELAELTEMRDEERRGLERRAEASKTEDPRVLADQFRRMSPEEAREWAWKHRWYPSVGGKIEKIQKFANSDILGPIEDALDRPGKLEQIAGLTYGHTPRAPGFLGRPNWLFHATLRTPEQHRVEVRRGEPGASERTAEGHAIYLSGPSGGIDFRVAVDPREIDAYFEGIAKASVDRLNKAGKYALARGWRISPTYGRKCYALRPGNEALHFAFRFEHEIDGNTLLALLMV